VGALVLGVAGLGVLRGFHEGTPHLFPGPFGSLLLAALVVLFAAHVAGRRRGLDLLGPSAERPGLTLARTIPLLVAVVGEKWLSVELLANAYEWIEGYVSGVDMADSVYRLFSGLSLLAISLVFLWVLRQSRRRLRRLTTPWRLLEAIGLLGIAAVVTALLVVGVAASVGPLKFGIRNVTTSVLVVAIAAQIVRAVSEELFFRGLLQTTLSRLLELAGMPAGRPAQVTSILLVSIGFTLEHYHAGGPIDEALRSSLYVFAMSCIFGALLVASRNLYLVIAAHASINLVVGLLVPMPIASDLAPVLPPDIVAMWLVVLLFTGIAVAYRLRAGTAG
jgi:membrane protease YdiL (CAAX protease family)